MTIRPCSVTPLRIVLVFLAGLPPASAAELESGPPPNDGVVPSAFLGVGSTTEAGLFIGATFGLRVQRWGGRWAFGGDLGISDGTGSPGGAGRSWLPYFSSLSTAGTRVGHDRVAAFALVRASREIVPGWALSLGAGVEHRTLLEYTQSCTRASGLDDEICGDANTSWYTTAYGPVVDLSLGTTMFRHHLDASLHVQGRSDSALVFLEAAYGPVFRRKTHTEREAVMVLGEENGTFRSSVPLTSAGTWTASRQRQSSERDRVFIGGSGNACGFFSDLPPNHLR